MADPLSLAAGSFAIIGVLDVVVRASVEMYKVLSDIQHAPKELEDLRQCILDNTELLDATKALLKELESEGLLASVPSVKSNLLTSELTSAIKAMDRELKSLALLDKRHDIANKSWGKVKWVLDARRVSRSIGKFEQTKTALSCALNLAGWQHQRLKLEEFETLVQNASKHFTSQQQTLCSIAVDKKEILLNQDQLGAASQKNAQESNRLRQLVLEMKHTSFNEHHLTRSHIDRSKSETIQVLATKLDEIHVAITPLNPIRRSMRALHFFGERRSNTLALLLLIKRPFHYAIIQLLSQKKEGVSADHLLWLQTEFEHLIASGTQEAARIFGGSTATCFDTWTYSGSFGSRTKNSLISPPSKRQGRERKKTLKQARRKVHSRSLCPGSKSVSIKFPIRTICITVPCLQGSVGATCCQERVSFSFTPCRGLLPNFIDVHFIKALFNGPEPKICGQINTFRLVDDWSLHHQFMSQGTIEEIDTAIRNRIISPYDMNKRGHSCCLGYAVFFGRVDVLRYLDDQGVGVRSMKGNYGMLEASWEAILSDSRAAASTVDLPALFDYLGQNATLSFNSLPLGALNWIREEECSETTMRHARHWMTLLKDEEFDFNQRDEFDLTPLFSHLSRPGGQSLDLVRLLLDFDADVHEKDPLGANAIQVAMYSGFGESLRDSADVLEEKISLMIERGVDIHHRNKKNWTPSFFARFSNDSWTAWCRALERNDFEIEDVLARDNELYLLHEEPELACYDL